MSEILMALEKSRPHGPLYPPPEWGERRIGELSGLCLFCGYVTPHTATLLIHPDRMAIVLVRWTCRRCGRSKTQPYGAARRNEVEGMERYEEVC